MDRWLESLIEVLQQTEAAYVRLQALIEDESGAALASDIDRVLAVAIEKENCVSRIRGLDQERSRVLKHLSGALNIPVEELTVSRMAALVRSPLAQQLQQIQQRLNTVLAQVRHANDQSGLLIRHCLRLVHHSLGFFHHWMEAPNSYGAAGDLRNPASDNGRLISGCA
jgi:flagellar biosynthesis/type III secretory pathway chaperone